MTNENQSLASFLGEIYEYQRQVSLISEFSSEGNRILQNEINSAIRKLIAILASFEEFKNRNYIPDIENTSRVVVTDAYVQFSGDGWNHSGLMGLISLDRFIPSEFDRRNFHRAIHENCRELFRQKNYFHAVHEGYKALEKIIQEKSNTDEDGAKLISYALGVNGVIKLNACKTDSEKGSSEGMKHIATGLLRAYRNTTSHERAVDWPIGKQQCLDVLSSINLILQNIDK